MSDPSFDLFAALRAGEVGAVVRAIAIDPSLAEVRDADGVSLLMTALYHRQRELTAAILESVEALDIFEVSALGRLDEVVAIGERTHTALTARSADGFTALHLAAFFGHADVVSWMLRHGAPVDAIAANPSLVRPLHSAVAARSTPVVELLLNAGADPSAPQRGGWTALHAAARNGDLHTVELLLSKGAVPDLASDSGETPADLASAEGRTAVVERIRGGES